VQNIEYVQATVTSLAKTTCDATLFESGEAKAIIFDACVIAIGANHDWKGLDRDLPATPEASKAEARLLSMKKEGERLMNASSVVMVAGGLIGCELAGDLAAYSKKAGKSPKITLVHSGEHLCKPFMAPADCNAVQGLLEEFGVKVILNEKVSESGGKVLLGTSKEEIEAEVVIKTIGFIPANLFVKTGLPEALDD
jgi:NADH dehydrogenase FAD-containing subunit